MARAGPRGYPKHGKTDITCAPRRLCFYSHLKSSGPARVRLDLDSHPRLVAVDGKPLLSQAQGLSLYLGASISRECKVCGAQIPARVGHGRPREWCSPDCYDVELAQRRECGRELRACRHCGIDISDRRGNTRFCSREHYYADRGIKLHRDGPPAERPCAVCSKPFRPKSDRAKYCSVQCKGRRPKPPRKRRYTEADRARYQRKHAIRQGAATGRPVVMCEIGNRDGWRCDLCRKTVDRWLEYPDPLSPSLDHIVPLSLGGIHDPSNVRVTHLRCNIKRGNRVGGEQLPLAGLLGVL